MTAPTAPTSELGYANEKSDWWRPPGVESTPELVWPLSIEVYDRMRRQDAQVTSVLRAVTLPVRRTTWRLDPGEARPEVTALVAADLGLPVVGQSEAVAPLRTRDRFSWSAHLQMALLMVVYGHMPFEQVYRLDSSGYARLRKLAPRMPRTLSAINVANDGGLESIEQYAPADPKFRWPATVKIPVNRLVMYCHDREGGDWLGTALDPQTPIPTPSGWTTMGQLQPGDQLFDESGNPCTVTATRRWDNRPCYRIAFDDGEEIVADANHLWQVHTYRSRNVPNARADKSPELLTTEQMVTRGVHVYGRAVNHAVALADPLQLPDAELPVDPYVLGAWLGDGSQSSGTVRLCDAKGDVAAEIERRGYPVTRRGNWEQYRAWSVPGLYRQLRVAGIITGSDRRGTIACVKHVPAVYLRASVTQRLDLLRGLMDTDGHFDQTNGQCIFTNTNKALADAVVELADSLGAKTKVQYVPQAGAVGAMVSGATINSRKDIYRVKFTARFIAFTMKRKAKLQDVERAAKRPFHYVRSIEIESSRDTVCIEVDSPSHLYLCGIGMKATHNSLLRPAYKYWLIKDRLLRVQAQTIERNGMGVPLYKGAPGETDLTEGLKMATGWRAGDSSGAAVQHEADLLLRGVEGDLPDANVAIRYLDEQIARAVLAHFLNLGTQTGSWALGSTFADFFTFSLQTLGEQARDTANAHVVEDIVDVNFGPDEPAPRIVFEEIGSRHAATAQAIKLLADAGILLPDRALEEAARQQFGLPPKDLPRTEPIGA